MSFRCFHRGVHGDRQNPTIQVRLDELGAACVVGKALICTAYV
jgi:hypothetical protein